MKDTLKSLADASLQHQTFKKNSTFNILQDFG